MIARVRAVLRRSGTAIHAPAALLQFGRLEIDEAAREARVEGVDVRLKPREFALLLELATNVGIALSRERLLERVWGFDFDGEERTVDVHVRRLRAKIEEEAKLPPMVQTIHGFATSSCEHERYESPRASIEAQERCSHWCATD